MRITSATCVAAVLVTASVGVALWAWIMLPAGGGVPVNYLGLDGVRHHGVSRLALWLAPVTSGLVTIAMTAAPGLSRRSGVERAAEVFDMTMIAMAGLLLVTQAALVGRAFDEGFDVMPPVAIATGVLLLAVGNYLGKARQNGFIGLKTPWTLANAGVWDKTHRFTGRVMVLGGLVLIGAGFSVRDPLALGLAIGACTAAPLLLGAAHSRSLYRGLQGG